MRGIRTLKLQNLIPNQILLFFKGAGGRLVLSTGLSASFNSICVNISHTAFRNTGLVPRGTRPADCRPWLCRLCSRSYHQQGISGFCVTVFSLVP